MPAAEYYCHRCFLFDRMWELAGAVLAVCSGGATEDVTTRTQLNHFSMVPLNNGPAGTQRTAVAESMALLPTTSNQASLKLTEPDEVSAL
jgi:hypothetical protein